MKSDWEALGAGDTVERGVWHRMWVVVRKQRTDVNRRALEGWGASAVFLFADDQGSPRLGEESARLGICRPGFIFFITSQLCD